MKCILSVALSACLLAGLSEAAGFALVSPAPDAVVPLVPAPYKTYLAGDRAMRRRQFADPAWRKEIAASAKNKPLGVRFAWKGSSGGTLDVSRKSDGATFCTVTIPSNEYTLANFEIAREYAWRVTAPDGRVLSGAFRTEDVAPRLIDWPGVPNVRDLGGRRGTGGRRVRQGLVYRSAGLNDNASWKSLTAQELNAARTDGTLERKLSDTIEYSGEPVDVRKVLCQLDEEIKKTGEVTEAWCDRRFAVRGTGVAGRSRLTEVARAWGCAWLGIRTDLDLRTYREVYGMEGSPLGPGVKFVNVSSANYEGLASESGRKAFAKDFRLFLDRANYPIVFHCIAGADRTGSLACILNGLLGVDEEELYRDWEVTGLSNSNAKFVHGQRFDKLVSKVFDTHEGRTLNDRIEAYVLSCGFTREDIAAFRAIMLE